MVTRADVGPYGILYTWTTYGTWLPGDERGSTDEAHNVVGSPRRAASRELRGDVEARLREPPLVLTNQQRILIDRSIRDLCAEKEWSLYAVNVRTNHVHTVVGIRGGNVDRALVALKARATAALREDGALGTRERVWSRGGSTRYLWTREDVERAMAYVGLGQGENLVRPWRDG